MLSFRIVYVVWTSTTKFLVNKIVKIPTTTVLKGVFFQVWRLLINQLPFKEGQKLPKHCVHTLWTPLNWHGKSTKPPASPSAKLFYKCMYDFAIQCLSLHTNDVSHHVSANAMQLYIILNTLYMQYMHCHSFQVSWRIKPAWAKQLLSTIGAATEVETSWQKSTEVDKLAKIGKHW